MDGLPAEFYQIDPDLFAQALQFIYHAALHRRRFLGVTGKIAVCLLYKAGDTTAPKNYRPIGLTTIDLKILAKTLNYRILRLIPTLCKSDQKGSLKGRSIHSNLQLVRFLQD